MPVPLALAGIGAAVSAIAGLIGNALSRGDRDEADRLMQQAEAEYGRDILPRLQDTVARQQERTGLSSIQEDPRLRDTQMRTLDQLQNVYETGGMTEADQAALSLAQQKGNQVAASQNAGAQQSAAQRGATNSGLSAALASQAGQAGANAAATAGAQYQASARDRALQALTSQGQLAGGIRGQDYGIAADAAGAQDSINRFNEGQQAENDRYLNDLKQRRFGNETQMIEGRNAARTGRANVKLGNAAATQQSANNVGGAINSLGSTAADYLNDPRKKKG